MTSPRWISLQRTAKQTVISVGKEPLGIPHTDSEPVNSHTVA